MLWNVALEKILESPLDCKKIKPVNPKGNQSWTFIESESLSCVWLFATPWTRVHGILQARILEWVTFPFSRGSFKPRDRTQVSCIAGRIFPSWAIRETPILQTRKQEWPEQWIPFPMSHTQKSGRTCPQTHYFQLWFSVYLEHNATWHLSKNLKNTL